MTFLPLISSSPEATIFSQLFGTCIHLYKYQAMLLLTDLSVSAPLSPLPTRRYEVSLLHIGKPPLRAHTQHVFSPLSLPTGYVHLYIIRCKF